MGWTPNQWVSGWEKNIIHCEINMSKRHPSSGGPFLYMIRAYPSWQGKKIQWYNQSIKYKE
ncbi:hypothetical protein Saga11_19590 [Bacillus safensis]|nr:hypothetical protein Saga11_19590 [Bacillus safensis]